MCPLRRSRRRRRTSMTWPVCWRRIEMPEDKETTAQNGCSECKRKDKDAHWREDFPVGWESDNYVTRREMVKFLALGSLTIAGANVVVAGLPHILKAAEMPRTKVGVASSIPAGASKLFAYPTAQDPCILVR